MWFKQRLDDVRINNLEQRVTSLEQKMSSAGDILEATERMDRIIKRSFRLKAQMDALEASPGKEPVEHGKLNTPVLSRAELLRMRG